MRRVRSFFVFVGVIAIPVTIMLTTGFNPLSWLNKQIEARRTLSDPPTVWQASLGNTPDWVLPAGNSVLVAGGDQLVSAVDTGTGTVLWHVQAAYGGVAGAGAGSVVVLGGEVLPDGKRTAFEVRDPYSGSVLWKDDAANGAWTYANLVVTLSCPKSAGCTLTGYQPRSGNKLWSADLPAGARVLGGYNHSIAAPHSLLAPGVGVAPPVLGFPVDDSVYLVDTATGTRYPTQKSTADSRIVAAGTGQLRIDAKYVNGGCRYTLSWTPLTRAGKSAARAWQSTIFQARTGDGSVCEQRGGPTADGDPTMAGRLYLYFVGPGREDTVMDVATGKVVYTAGDGGRVVGLGGADPTRPDVALVRTGDGKALTARALATGKELWRQAVSSAVTVTTNGTVVSFLDAGTGKLAVRRVADGAVVLQADTLSLLVGYGADGVVLGETLRVGLLRYQATVPAGGGHP